MSAARRNGTTNAEKARLAEARLHRTLATLGAVPQRAAVGHGSRRLQRGRRSLGIFSARSRAVAGVSLGRGRTCSASATIASGSASRSPCGTATIRSSRSGSSDSPARGQSRRGRQGILLLPRQHADARVHEGAVQVSAGALSRTTDLVAENARRGRARSRVRTRRTRASSRTTPISTSSSSMRKIDHDDLADRDTRSSIADRDAATLARAADAVVSQQLVVERGDRRDPTLRDARRRTRRASTRAHPDARRCMAVCEGAANSLFTENETNVARALRRSRTQRRTSRTASTRTSCTASAAPSIRARHGTKAAVHYALTLAAGRDGRRCACGSPRARSTQPFDGAFDADVRAARREADAFYAACDPFPTADDERAVQRRPSRGCCGPSNSIITTCDDWLDGDPSAAAAARERARRPQRTTGATSTTHDILSMPDKWEYPWFAAWDLAFHVIPLAMIDPDFAKQQLLAVHARMVHASERPDSRLRMGVRRRQSAGPRVGGAARLSHRRRKRPGSATARSSSASSRNCC